MKSVLGTLALSVILGGSALGGDNWPQWRGPSLNGTSDSTGLPEKWSDSENVKPSSSDAM